jgi:hypothetical protein
VTRASSVRSGGAAPSSARPSSCSARMTTCSRAGQVSGTLQSKRNPPWARASAGVSQSRSVSLRRRGIESALRPYDKIRHLPSIGCGRTGSSGQTIRAGTPSAVSSCVFRKELAAAVAISCRALSPVLTAASASTVTPRISPLHLVDAFKILDTCTKRRWRCERGSRGRVRGGGRAKNPRGIEALASASACIDGGRRSTVGAQSRTGQRP